MAAQSLPKTLNGITYTDYHHSMLNAYTDPVKVARWSDNYFSSLDGYQRLVREAKLQSGESVLDVACGTGLVGLLACEELGNERQQVYFVDYSPLMLAEAKAEVRRRHGSFPDCNFQRVADIRSPSDCEAFKTAMGKPNGFDVVFVNFLLSHFTVETQQEAIRHWLTLLAPGPKSRLVIEWCTPSACRDFDGEPSEMTCVGLRTIAIAPGWNDLQNWNMTHKLDVRDFLTLVSSGDKGRARKALKEFVKKAYGTVVSSEEVHERPDSNNQSPGVIADAAAKKDFPSEVSESSRQDWMRKRYVVNYRAEFKDKKETGEIPRGMVLFDMPFSFIAVVKAGSSESNKTKKTQR